MYGQDKIPWALEHFFKPEKLSILREIALREVAQSIDRTVSAQIPANEVSCKAAASERVMVCLSSRSPRGATLLQRGSRLAGRLNTDWFVVYVETPGEALHRIDAEAQRLLLENQQRARELGAQVVRLQAKEPVAALIEFARSHGIAHIMVGRSQRPWWRQLLGQLVTLRLAREAEGFDLHIVSCESEEGRS
jgi:two-component system sensor histidine kinase KdpD